MPQKNFGRNIHLMPETKYFPKSEKEVLEILDRHQGQRIRSVGRLHSWSRVLETDDVLLDLRHLCEVLPEAEEGLLSVRVGAGCQIKRLLGVLKDLKGWTLPSVGFITEQTVAGAISTGTHGSGRNSLSHYVLSVRIARYDPGSGKSVIEEITNGEALRAARCSLGCLGVILSVQMQCRPAYNVEEHFHEYSQLGAVIDAESEFPLQQFYLVPWRWTYFAQHRRETEHRPSKLLWLYQWYRFLVFDLVMHLIILLVVRLLRYQLLVRVLFRWVVPAFVIRDWRVTGPSQKQLVMEHELFRHIEIELFVQKSQLSSALNFLKQVLSVAGNANTGPGNHLLEQLARVDCTKELYELSGIYCHHYPICIRKILPDDTLISMASGASPASQDLADDEPWYSITLTNYHRGRQREAFEQLAGFLARSMSKLFRARPHWGKLCPPEPQTIRSLYPKFREFQEICHWYDPQGVFTNNWTKVLLDEESQHEASS